MLIRWHLNDCRYDCTGSLFPLHAQNSPVCINTIFMNTKRRRLAIFVSFSGTGGVERVVHHLLQGLAAHDLEVDLVAVVGKNGWLPEIPWPNIRVIDLKVKHTHLALPGLTRYLRKERPDVLMAAKDRAIRIAVLARMLARVDTRLVGQLHNNISGYLDTKTPLQRWLRCAPMRWLFPFVDLIITVSEGVIEDTVKVAGYPRERLVALPNPVITPDVYRKGEEPVDHPWLNHPSIRVIMGAGRLTREKDFATLIKAFKQVRQHIDCKLVIIGEGPKRKDLEQLVEELDLKEQVSMPGYAANPYAWMKKAKLFVLSSEWEGSGNVLIEAMALGVPAVSTDCPYGPSETLAKGKYGALVPVGDPESMAKAMLDTLSSPLSANALHEAVAPFTLERSTQRYLEVLGLAR
jgi:glycosyltransferase involved in cell wall biosynthesis